MGEKFPEQQGPGHFSLIMQHMNFSMPRQLPDMKQGHRKVEAFDVFITTISYTLGNN